MPLLLALLLLAAPATAEEPSGMAFFANATALIKWCSGSDKVDIGLCAGFLRAVGEREYFIETDKTFCLPDEWTDETLKPVVLAWASRNADKLEKTPALGAAHLALYEAYPCGRPSPRR